MKIVDCFTFFNEIDLLKFRLEYLEGLVDYHVIVESDHTFSGNPKPYYLEENLKYFTKYKNRIVYVKIEQDTSGLIFDKVDTYTPTNGPWILEYQQRNGILSASAIIEDSDIVFIGDLDEIPSRDVLHACKTDYITSAMPVACSQLFHYYYMNCQNTSYDRWWNGTVICKGIHLKDNTPQQLRDRRNEYPRISEAGYHFSWLNGPEAIKQKLESFSHTEFNRPDINSEDNIKKAIEQGVDVLKRPGVTYKFVDLSEYPDDIRELMLKYPKFIK